MLTAVKSRMRQQGFTFLEIIVVLVVIAIVTGMALMIFSHFGEAQTLLQQQQLSKGVLQYAREDAIVNQNVSGVRFYDDGYALVQLNAKHKFIAWHPIAAAEQHQTKVAYQLITAHKQDDSSDNSYPDVIAFTPSGAVYGSSKYAPYKIKLTLQRDGKTKTISVQQNGVIGTGS